MDAETYIQKKTKVLNNKFDRWGFMQHTGSLISIMNYDSKKFGNNNAVVFRAPEGQQVGLNLIDQMKAASDLLEACQFTKQYLEIQELTDTKLYKDVKQAITEAESC